jgi:hypothetical protein
MVDKIICFEKEKEKRLDAKTLVQIGREIRKIDDADIRDRLMEAWQDATIKFFGAPSS